MKITIALLIAALTTGCLHNSSTTVTYLHDRQVTATTHGQQGVGISAFDDHATFRLPTLTLQITQDAISWPPNHTLPLPSNWKHLDLDDTGTQITLRLDHHAFTTIPTPQWMQSPISH